MTPAACITSILNDIAQLKAPRLIAIDGRCGSGKTTLATALASALHAQLVHMDDFYLPFDMRTRERMSQPGGNVHYERVLKDIVTPVTLGQVFDYEAFDSKEHRFFKRPIIESPALVIIEGAYAMHPFLLPHYDYTVFVTVDPMVQLQRIKLRNGEKKMMEFELRWIPLEERYIGHFQLNNLANRTIDTTSMW